MFGTNGTHTETNHQLDSFKASVKKLVDRASTKPDGQPTWFKSAVSKTGEMIKAHPIAAIGVAVGAGYLFVRILRSSRR